MTRSSARTVSSACWLPPGLREKIDALPGGSTPFCAATSTTTSRSR